MAKKSKKSRVNLILNLVTIALGGLLLGFLALPHITIKAGSEITGTYASSVSGYDLISFEEGADTGVAVVLLFVAIFASLLVVAGLVKLLADSGTIKLNTRIVGMVEAIIALALLAFLIANIFTVKGICNGVEDSLITLGNFAVYATLIINAIIGAVAFVTSLLSIKK